MSLMLALTEGSSAVLDTEVLTFIINSLKQLIGILTTPPLGVFLTIGVVGSIAGLVGTIVNMVKGGSH